MTRFRAHIRLASVLATLIASAAFVLAMPALAAAASVDAVEQQEVDLINQYRAQSGLPQLALDATLSTTAQWMGTDMATNNRFSHTDSLGRDPFARLQFFGYPSDTWRGENLAAGNEGTDATFQQWRTSPPHNENMLNPNYRAIGIARVYNAASPYQYYWVTEFGSRVDKSASGGGGTSTSPATPNASFANAAPSHVKAVARRCGHVRKGSARWRTMKCAYYVRAARRLRHR